MVIHKILRRDGTVISSGTVGTAISQAEITWDVSAGEELNPGAVSAAMAEIRFMDCPEAPLTAGEEFSLYEGDRLLGIFIGEKPERKSAASFSVTAYDRVSLLDKKLDAFLNSLTGWPYTLSQLAQMVCGQCGVVLKEEEYPGGEYLVSRFSGENLTGRAVMKWICQALGKFCRATPTGELEFSWYAPCDLSVGVQAGEGVVPFLGGSLNYSDFATAPIEKVQLRRRAEDVGVIYPESGENALIIEGNPLLAAEDGENLLPIAQNLYEAVKDISYTPFSVSLPAGAEIYPGHIVKISDGRKTVTGIVMTKVRSGQKDTISCTGSPHRESVEAVNRQSYESLQGRVMHLRADVTGLQAENSDMAGNLANLKLTVEGIGAEVSRRGGQADALQTQLTKVSQSATDLTLQVQSIRDTGVSKVETQTGYRFDHTGLHISKSDSEMENRLDHTGMYVERSGETILQANAAGVVATDVSVRNYLIVGSHARFEDYEGGTGCFFI